MLDSCIDCMRRLVAECGSIGDYYSTGKGGILFWKLLALLLLLLWMFDCHILSIKNCTFLF